MPQNRKGPTSSRKPILLPREGRWDCLSGSHKRKMAKAVPCMKRERFQYTKNPFVTLQSAQCLITLYVFFFFHVFFLCQELYLAVSLRNWRTFKSLDGLGDPYLSFSSLDTKSRSLSFFNNCKLRFLGTCVSTCKNR